MKKEKMKILSKNAVEMKILEQINHNSFIDIHTHKENVQENSFQIINILIKKLPLYKPAAGLFYSVGHHPWHIGEVKDYIQKIIRFARDPHIIAIGEIGLDRLTSEPIEKQMEIFTRQYKLAVSFEKPVIVHCVKAYSDLLAYLKKNKPTVPMIIHGFNENENIVKELLEYDIYLSFGHQLLNTRSKAYKSFNTTPLEKIFLETDQSDLFIRDIYEAVASIKAVPMDELKKQIFANFRQCFKISE